MNTLEAYNYSKSILEKDYTDFENHSLNLIKKYGEDYNIFIQNYVENTIGIFYQKMGQKGKISQ